MSEFLDRVYGVALNRANRGDIWGSICAVTYADTIALNQAMEGVEGVSVDGKLIAAVPSPDSSSAKSLVEAMRNVLISALPMDHRVKVTGMFKPVDFLEDHEAPATKKVQDDSLRSRTEGLKPHAFKARRSSDSRVHARASIKMSEAGVDDVDIHAAVRSSDVSTFEATSIEYSLARADWQLEGHSIRMELAEEMINNIDPGKDKELLRTALKEQFEGTDFTRDIEWVIA